MFEIAIYSYILDEAVKVALDDIKNMAIFGTCVRNCTETARDIMSKVGGCV